MEREKFDRSLSLVILNYDEEYVPAFDKDRVWRKIEGSKNRRKIVIACSAAAAVLIALMLVIPLGKDEIIEKSTLSSVSGVIIKQPAEKVNKKVPQVHSGEVAQLKPAIIVSETLVAAPIVEKSDTESFENKTIEIASLLSEEVKPVETIPEGIKVVFKRGKSEEKAESDVKITFVKGRFPKSNREKSFPSDSAYYVNSQKPFKLKLKK